MVIECWFTKTRSKQKSPTFRTNPRHSKTILVCFSVFRYSSCLPTSSSPVLQDTLDVNFSENCATVQRSRTATTRPRVRDWASLGEVEKPSTSSHTSGVWMVWFFLGSKYIPSQFLWPRRCLGKNLEKAPNLCVQVYRYSKFYAYSKCDNKQTRRNKEHWIPKAKSRRSLKIWIHVHFQGYSML